MTGPPRQRNRRGEGSKLRAEILDAAADLLEETGSEQEVTLRAIARHVGIAAPSIYEHFPNRDAIVQEVVDRAFIDLRLALQGAWRPETTPAGKLQAAGLAYLTYAQEQPNRYRLLFARRDLIDSEPTIGPHQPAADNSVPLGPRPLLPARPAPRETFLVLVNLLAACVDAGQSTSADPFGDAVTLWIAMHGYAMLRISFPQFPLPKSDEFLDRALREQGHLTELPAWTWPTA
jgi:AcrR family transcriptional regulator